MDQSVFHVDYGRRVAITKFSALISERTLVVVVVARKGLPRRKGGGIVVWDWRNGHKKFVSISNSVRLARGLVV